MSDAPTREGIELIRRFLLAQESLEQSRHAVNRDECELANAESALAKWLMPSDMKPGEKVAVWMGSSLFQVELEPRTAYAEGGEPHVTFEPKVTVRTRGKDHYRLREAV